MLCLVDLRSLLYLFLEQTSLGNAAKKPKLPVASVFGNDSDEEQS